MADSKEMVIPTNSSCLANVIPTSNSVDKPPANEVDVDEGGFEHKHPPNALANDSEEARLSALMPNAEEGEAMKKRKLKAKKLVEKRTLVSTINPRKRYMQKKEMLMFEKKKLQAADTAAQDVVRENEEAEQMLAEERRTWDAFELNFRNHLRMVEQAQEVRRKAITKMHKDEEHRRSCEEEGLTFDHGVTVQYRRWRASPAQVAVLSAHQCQTHGMCRSNDGRWILSGGDDCVVRLWDTQAFARKVVSADRGHAVWVAKHAGAVAANVALGWECMRECIGHTAAIRDVTFNPRFIGLPDEGIAQYSSREATTVGEGHVMVKPKNDDELVCRKRHEKHKTERIPGEKAPPRLEHTLASASADRTVCVWDFSFNPRIPRFILCGHKGVVYGCRFAPSGTHLASGSADGTVRLWDIIEGCEIFCYTGHSSPVTSLCYSPSGRYLASCSDIGESSIRVWFAEMPVYDRDPVPLGMRLRWGRSGLVKRIKVTTEPASLPFFLTRQEEQEGRESSDESSGEKFLAVPRSVLDQSETDPFPSKAVSEGFSLSVTLLNESGTELRTEEYYRGCKLILHAHGLESFTGLYVAAVSAEGMWEGYESRGARRYGTFFTDLPEGISLSAGRSIAAGDDLNRSQGGVNEVLLRWKANNRLGVGWLTFRAMANRSFLGSETVWVTLRERAPPMLSAALSAAKVLKPRKRNFDTVKRTRLFAKALQEGDGAGAAMMLSAMTRLEFGRVIASGATEVMKEVRSMLGRNITISQGLSVGVAWTSIRMTHEPPLPSPADSSSPQHRKPDDLAAPKESLRSPSSSSSLGSSGFPRSPGSPGSLNRNSCPDSLDPRRSTDSNGHDDVMASFKGEMQTMCHDTVESPARCSGMRMKEASSTTEQESSRRRLPNTSTRKRRKRCQPACNNGTDSRGSYTSTDQGLSAAGIEMRRRGDWSDDEADSRVRAAMEKKVVAELKHLNHMREAGIESWKELGDATDPTALFDRAKNRKVSKKRPDTADRSSDLARLLVRDPQVGLKVLVWDGYFGADFPELRMPLPNHYPLKSMPYDQNEDTSARAMEEALAAGDRIAKQLVDEITDDGKDETIQIQRLADSLLKSEWRRRHVAMRRRDAIGNPSDIAASFPSPAPNITPVHASEGASTVVPMEANPIDGRLQDTASRHKKNRDAERRVKHVPPIDPPPEYNVRRRRGGLGNIPGSLPLIARKRVWDWERDVARKTGGLLRQFQGRFESIVCHQDTINAVSYSPDGRRLASASSDGTIKLWDAQAGKQVRLIDGGHEGLPVWDVSWSTDSVFLVSCGADRSIAVWNTAVTEAFVRRFRGHYDHVKRCIFADDRGEAILSCGSDGTVRKWALTPNVPAPPPKPHVTYKTKTWIMLNWQSAAGSNEEITAYVVSWRLGRKGQFADQLTVPGDQHQRDITDLLPGSVYFFRVAAMNRMGQGPWSEITDVVNTEMDVPLRIGRPRTENITPTSITISFFVPRPTLPDMKMKHFVVQAKGGGSDFDDGKTLHCSWEEALEGGRELKAINKTRRRSAQRAAGSPQVSNGSSRGKNMRRERKKDRKRHNFHRRLPHHQLMVVTYKNLQPGIHNQLRVAGVNGVGQGEFSPATYSTLTPAVPPGPCPPPTVSGKFLTAMAISWIIGEDGGSSITAFIVRPTGGGETDEVRCGRMTNSHLFEGLHPGHPYSFQVRAANNEGFGPWSSPSEPAWTFTKEPAAPPPPAVAQNRPPPGPHSLWLSLLLPKDDGGDPVTAMLLEMREHTGTGFPEWGRCERHHVRCGDGQQTETSRTSVLSKDSSTPRMVVIMVSDLKPRTFYSFRTSAINAKGAGEPGLPCRRVRTSPPQPPSWQDCMISSSTGARVEIDMELDAASRPTTRLSGPGACTVMWNEPLLNGAPINAYELESARITIDGESTSKQPREGSGSLLLPLTLHDENCSQPRKIISVGVRYFAEDSGNAKIITEHKSRTLPAHARSYVMRGLASGSQYMFRVAGVNMAGKGEPGQWSQVVHIP